MVRAKIAIVSVLALAAAGFLCTPQSLVGQGEAPLSGVVPLPTASQAPAAAPPSAPTSEAPSGPQPTATSTGVLFRDGFDASTLGEGWTWVRENPSAWSLTEQPGSLTLRTGEVSLILIGGDAPVLLRPAPDGDFEVQAKVTFAPTQNFQSANIVIYRDDDHFVTLGRAYCGAGSCVGDGAYMDNDEVVTAAGFMTNNHVGGLPAGPVYLRLVKQGNQYTGYWSGDGQNWVTVMTTPASFTPLQAGMFASGGRRGAAVIAAQYDYFEIRAVGQ